MPAGTKIEQGRIYHHYEKWEDWKHGFYDNCSGNEKEKKIALVLEMFNDENKTREYMTRVINEWVYSCEHNLTNSGMNKIAYLGQAACCLYAKIPNTITMEAWSLLENKIKKRSNKIAEEVLNIWINKIQNKQLCLNFI